MRYHHLLDIGRAVVEEQVGRPPLQKFLRWSLRQVLPYPGKRLRRCCASGGSGACCRRRCRRSCRRSAGRQLAQVRARAAHVRCSMAACSGIDANINAATARVLDRSASASRSRRATVAAGGGELPPRCAGRGPGLRAPAHRRLVSGDRQRRGRGDHQHRLGLRRLHRDYGPPAARRSGLCRRLRACRPPRRIWSRSSPPSRSKTCRSSPGQRRPSTARARCSALKLAGKVEAVLTRLGFR